MNVVITGGAGFVGSHIADQLLSRGHKVLVIDNYSTGRRDNLAPHERLSIREGSIADRRLVDECFQEFQPDIVVHAAASYKDPTNWVEDVETNVRGTAIVAQAARQANVSRMIYFQTALCYGLKPLEQPITLRHPILPEGSSYAISKTSAEQYLWLSGLECVSFRLANVYGPRNLSGPLPTFFHRLSNNKPCFVMDTRRDFVYVSDLVEVVATAVNGDGKPGPYHVSSGTDYSIKELCDATVEAMEITLNADVEVRPRSEDDAFSILLDPSKTKTDFSWHTTTTLEAGVREAVRYYQQYGITETYTHLKQLDEKDAA